MKKNEDSPKNNFVVPALLDALLVVTGVMVAAAGVAEAATNPLYTMLVGATSLVAGSVVSTRHYMQGDPWYDYWDSVLLITIACLEFYALAYGGWQVLP